MEMHLWRAKRVENRPRQTVETERRFLQSGRPSMSLSSGLVGSIRTRRQLYQMAGFAVSFVVLGVGFPLIYLMGAVHFDEAIWLVTADQMAQGNALYGDIYDHKPPGIFYLTLAGERFVATFDQQLQIVAYGTNATEQGLTVYVLRLLTYGVTGATGLLVCALGRRLYDRGVGMMAGLIFLASTYLPHFAGYYFLTEPWAILPTVAAAILLLEDRPLSDLVAGGALGVGVLFNQTVFLFGLAFVAFRAVLLRYRHNRSQDYLFETVRRFGVIGIGFAVPVSVVLIVFYSRGLLTELLYYTIYLPLVAYSPPFTVHGRILATISLAPVWLLAFGTIVKIGTGVVRGQQLANPVFETRNREVGDGGNVLDHRAILFVALWAVFVSYPGAAGFDAQHQLLFVFPPIALLAAVGAKWMLDAAWERFDPAEFAADAKTVRSRRIPTIAAILLVVLLVSVGFNGVYVSNTMGGGMHGQIAESQAVEERVDGPIYTWPPQQNHLYYFGDDVDPAPTYFMTVYDRLVSDRVVRDLERAEVEYVVVSDSHVEDGRITVEQSKWFADEKVELVAYLNRNYEPVDETEQHVIFRSTGDR